MSSMFAAPDRIIGTSTYATALTGGSWSGTLPLANLKNRLLSKVARSTNALAASTTFDVDMGVPRTIRVLSVLNHNATVNGLVRYRFYSDSGYTALVYDTGDVALIGDATLTTEDLTGWRPDWWLVMPADVVARYCRVNITDTANPAGYFELGRCCILSAWAPAIDVSFGQSIKWDHSNTRKSTSYGGTRFYMRGTPFRVSSVKFTSIVSGEAHQAWLEMQRRLGVDGEVFFIKDSTETDFYRKQQSFLANIREMNPLENPYHNNFNTELILEGVI